MPAKMDKVDPGTAAIAARTVLVLVYALPGGGVG